MTAILGLNSFHADSAACLVLDGELVGAVAEERLGDRVKHTSAFPARAIQWLLADNGLKLRDINFLALPRNARANKAAKLAYVLRNLPSGIRASREHIRRSADTRSLIENLAEICAEDPAQIKFKTIPVEHHLAHIASSYYCSPFDGLTAGFSYDASGDFVSAMVARCEGNKINVLERVPLPNSLGFFYTALCQYIGFDEFGEEYKVMGLAPYGHDNHADIMKELVNLPSEGLFSLGAGFFEMHQGSRSGSMDHNNRLVMDRLYSDQLITKMGPATSRGVITQREMDIAKSVQTRFEDAAIHCLKRVHELVPTEQLVMAGGCALNGVANARILRETAFSKPYLQAAASDDGTCLGAAMWVWHNTVGSDQRFHMKHAFWGPRYSDAEMLSVANKSRVSVIECRDTHEAVEKVARLIADGSVVGWYQGRSEWGPRALGNRSILANPTIKTMKDTINSKIKRRESFRPFAPSVLQEDVFEYFEQDIYSPFMMHVVKLRLKYRELLPAITHIDGTGRLQSVSSENNPLYHQLISAVKKHTGFGVVLNTSFNENEPIVDTPQQALECFLRTDMDALCFGHYLMIKPSIN